MESATKSNKVSISKEEFVEFAKQLFELEQLSATDSFFEVGLDSIKIIRFINLVNSQFDLTLTIIDLYEANFVGDFYEKYFQTN